MKYLVSLPITGVACVEVEADSEDEAIEAALMSDLSFKDIEEWDVHRTVVRGNVYSGRLNNAEAQENE